MGKEPKKPWKEGESSPLSPLEVAEARIKLALFRYKLALFKHRGECPSWLENK